MTKRLLIVDDEEVLVAALVRHFERSGYEPTGVFTVSAATQAIETAVASARPFAAVLSDLQLPDGDGRAVLKWVRKRLPSCPVLLMTGSRWVGASVDAIRLGAVTVMEKPVPLQKLTAEIRDAIDASSRLPGGLHAASDAGFLGVSAQIREAIDVLLLAAPTDMTVLLEGETGTGKELAAQALHKLSRRAQRRIVAVNCAALSERVLERELFAHGDGPAGMTTMEQIRDADGGTLFLDEVADMPLAVQARLLRVLQEQDLRPAGSDKLQPMDVRVVAATNRSLEQHVEQGRFRADLYYRLNVVRLRLPPLRERREDIPLLAQHFLRSRSPSQMFTDAALGALERYDWPGNVRELENLTARLAVLKPRGDVDVADLPREFVAAEGRGEVALAPRAMQLALPEGAFDLPGLLGDLEDRVIRAALERTEGNKSEAARVLGINRTTLVEKLRRMSRRRDGH